MDHLGIVNRLENYAIKQSQGLEIGFGGPEEDMVYRHFAIWIMKDDGELEWNPLDYVV